MVENDENWFYDPSQFYHKSKYNKINLDSSKTGSRNRASVLLNCSTFCNFFEQDRFCGVHDEGRQAGNHDKNTQIPIITLPS